MVLFAVIDIVGKEQQAQEPSVPLSGVATIEYVSASLSISEL